MPVLRDDGERIEAFAAKLREGRAGLDRSELLHIADENDPGIMLVSQLKQPRSIARRLVMMDQRPVA